MAILHHKEDKIQVVLGRLPNTYTHEQFVEMFIKLYSKDWGKIKAAYIKQSQDKEPGTVINMPKPDLYLKQLLETYLQNNPVPAAVEKIVEPKVAKVKAIVAKKAEVTLPTETAAEKPKVVARKKAETLNAVEPVKKVKAPVKKKIAVEEDSKPVKAVKEKAPAKKKLTEEEAPIKVKKVKASEK